MDIWRKRMLKAVSGILACALCAGVMLGFVRIWIAWAESTDSAVIAHLPEEVSAGSLEADMQRHGGELCNADLGLDGSTETIRLFAANGRSSHTVMLSVYDEMGSLLDSARLIEVPRGESHTRFDLYLLNDGRLYAEWRLFSGGLQSDYAVFSLQGSELLMEKQITAMGDLLADDEIMRELSAAFAADGLRFVPAAVDMADQSVICASADLPGVQRLCSLTDFDKALAATPMPTPEPTPEPTAAPEPTYEPIATAEPVTEYIVSATEQPAEPAAITRSVIANSDVNVRAGAGTRYSVLGVLPSGGSLWYLKQQQSDDRGVVWYKVSYQNQDGWVSSHYTRIADGASAGESQSSDGAYVKVVGGKVKIRSGPGLGYTAIGQMAEGRVVPYLGQTSVDSRGVEWHYIDFNGIIGWVSSKYSMIIQ